MPSVEECSVRWRRELERGHQPAMSQMFVSGIAVEPRSRKPVLVLTDSDNRRALPIWIGSAEATAINLALEGVETDRPMSHDLILDIVDAVGYSVARVDIYENIDNVFFASLSLTPNGSTYEALYVDGDGEEYSGNSPVDDIGEVDAILHATKTFSSNLLGDDFDAESNESESSRESSTEESEGSATFQVGAITDAPSKSGETILSSSELARAGFDSTDNDPELDAELDALEQFSSESIQDQSELPALLSESFNMIEPSGDHCLVIEARPSDAVAIAIKSGAPIFVSPQVFATGTVSLNRELDEKERQDFRSFISRVKASDFKLPDSGTDAGDRDMGVA